jgi:hypothetical protein
MSVVRAIDSQSSRESNCDQLPAIEPWCSCDATKDEIRNSRLARMYDGCIQNFRRSSQDDLQTVPKCAEDYEIATCLRLVGQSSQQPTEGALQNPIPERPHAREKTRQPPEESIGGLRKVAVRHCITISYTKA